ncbi:MAG: transketolase family protein, partial [Actinobacteria bacterium]|nr:transketolase family protein [Actinomycetota bacterium]
SMPNMTVLVPADSVETKKMVGLAAKFIGPIYLRLSRGEFPKIFEDSHEIVIGKGVVLTEGDDLTIISCGNLLYKVLMAAGILKQRGIYPRVININTLKPIDKELIIDSARRTGAIITVEEHNIIGGLFSAVSECLCSNSSILVEPIGIKDEYTRTAKSLDILFEYLGLTVENIIKTAKEIILKKKRMNCA